MKLKSIFSYLIIAVLGMFFASDLYAVPFKDLNPELVDKCVGCRYYSVLYDAMSQGGYRVYTGLFNICMFFLVVVFAFQMMKKIFKIVVSDMTQMESKNISNLDDFWKDTFKMILKSLFVIGFVFTTDPKSVTRWTIDPIVSGGIAVSRVFINYGIDQMSGSFGNTAETLNSKLVPDDVIPKIDLGIMQIPLYDINSPMKRSAYCSNSVKMRSDADNYERQDKENKLPHALPVLTKLELMCLMQEVGFLSSRYAGLATYYSLYTFNAKKIIYVPKTDKNANEVTFLKLTRAQAKNAENEIANTFSSSGNFMYFALTILFIFWLLGIGFGIYGLVAWLNLGTLITMLLSCGIPLVLLLLYFLFGGPALIMTLTYFVVYVLLKILMPFYFIQPMFHIAIILFAMPLIATAWATGDKGYLKSAIDTLVQSAIGMAVLCMLFVLCVFFNEITFYSLYGNWLTMSSIYEASENNAVLVPLLNLYNFLIMVMMNLFALYMMKNYSKVVSDLFGGKATNEFFGFAKELFTSVSKKITDVSKLIVGKEKEKAKEKK